MRWCVSGNVRWTQACVTTPSCSWARVWARQRSQALAYLKAELAGWSRVLDSRTPTARGHVRRAMEGWKISERLGYSPFEERLLAQLPEAERGAWRALRNEAESLLDRARNGDH